MTFNIKEEWIILVFAALFLLGVGYLAWYNIRAWIQEKKKQKVDQ